MSNDQLKLFVLFLSFFEYDFHLVLNLMTEPSCKPKRSSSRPGLSDPRRPSHQKMQHRLVPGRCGSVAHAAAGRDERARRCLQRDRERDGLAHQHVQRRRRQQHRGRQHDEPIQRMSRRRWSGCQRHSFSGTVKSYGDIERTHDHSIFFKEFSLKILFTSCC